MIIMENHSDLSIGRQSTHSNKDDESRNDDGGDRTTRRRRYDNSEIELLIDRFKKSDPEDIKKHVAHPNAFSLKDLKAISGYLKLSKHLNKDQLVENILKKLAMGEKVMETRPSPPLPLPPPQAKRRENTNHYNKDQNTVPRLLNILSFFLEDLLRVRNITKASNPESSTTSAGGGNPFWFWFGVSERFNDPDFNSGGLVAQHKELAAINPECTKSRVFMDEETARWHWNTVKKDYAIAFDRYTRFDFRNTDFWSYCEGKRDVLYMHLWVLSHLSHGREEVALFCRERVEDTTTTGFESSASTALLPALSSSSFSSSSAVALEGSVGVGSKRMHDEVLEEGRKTFRETPHRQVAVETSKSEHVDNKLQQESLQTRYATIALLNKDMLTYEEQLKKMEREGKTEGDRSFALTKRLFDMVCADLEALIN